MKPFDLESQLLDLLDGSLSDDEKAALFRKLDKDAEARALYLDFVHLQMALETNARPAPCINPNVVPMDLVLERQKRRTLRIAMIAASIALFLGLAGAFFVVLPTAPLARFTTSPETELTVTHSTAEGKKAPEGKSLIKGSRVQLKHGSLELNFKSGVKSVVLAPADFTLTNESLVDLNYGKIWFKVSEKAIGFQVNTPEFLLTDLGTEFGIASSSDIPDQVHVMSGIVRVMNHQGKQQEQDLTATHAMASLNDGGWEEVEYQSHKFLTNLPKSDLMPPHLYWSFDDDFAVTGTSSDAAVVDSRLDVQGEGPVLVSGKIGAAASFDAENDRIVTTWEGIGGKNPRTVAFWVKLPTDHLNYDDKLLSWGVAANELEVNDDWSVRAIFEKSNPDNTHLQLHLGACSFIGSTELKKGAWHHVAITYGGGIYKAKPDVKFYINGREDRTRFFREPTAVTDEINTIVDPAVAEPLMIGGSRSFPTRSCDAALDELYIFDSKLSREAIRLLAFP